MIKTTVILKSGQVIVFNVKACADIFIQAYFGLVVSIDEMVSA